MNDGSLVDPLLLHDARQRRRQQHQSQGEEEEEEEEGGTGEDQQRRMRVKFAHELCEDAERVERMRQTTIIKRNPLLRITVTEDQRTKDFYRNEHAPLLSAVSETPTNLRFDLSPLCIRIERDNQRGTTNSSSCSSFDLAEKIHSEEKNQGRRMSNDSLFSSVQFHVTPRFPAS